MGSHYIHGTDPDEQARLSRLNTLLNEASLEGLSLRGGERILDVGSGLAQLTRAMARAAGSTGVVVGVERSTEQMAEARRQAEEAGEAALVDLRQGEAGDLPLRPDEWESFDLAHTRFLLEHVTDPDVVVASMIRALRPGGRIVLEDDDHDVLRLWPEPAGVYALWRAYIKTFELVGNDPFIGRRLVALIHEAGGQPVRNHWMFFGSCSGDADFPWFIANFVGIIEGARDAILDAKLLRTDQFAAGIRSFQDWGRREDAALWYGRAWAEGRKPD